MLWQIKPKPAKTTCSRGCGPHNHYTGAASTVANVTPGWIPDGANEKDLRRKEVWNLTTSPSNNREDMSTLNSQKKETGTGKRVEI